MIRGIFQDYDGSWYYVYYDDYNCSTCEYLYEEPEVNWRECTYEPDYEGVECKHDEVYWFEDWVVDAYRIGNDDIDYDKIKWTKGKDEALEMLWQDFNNVKEITKGA